MKLSKVKAGSCEKARCLCHLQQAFCPLITFLDWMNTNSSYSCCCFHDLTPTPHLKIVMEASAARWFSNMGMDESFLCDWELTNIDEQYFNAQQTAPEALQQPLSSESNTSSPSLPPPAPAHKKMPRNKSWESFITSAPDASSRCLLSFGSTISPQKQSNLTGGAAASEEEINAMNPNGLKRSYDTMVGQDPKTRNEGPSHNQEHVLAERKRREKLNQRFIALSALVPGLKKMDKATVLEDAIKYLKQLQEKVKNLEEQAAKRPAESEVSVKRSHLLAADANSSTDEDYCDQSMPEIEARIWEKTILIKIHCNYNKGVVVKALSEIEKLHLSVINTSVVPFTGCSLDITVMAQIEVEFSMTVKDVVKKMNSAFRQFT
ncbi:transcription factor bHLH18 [Canna indica]|uniref:Transcription factor bHLH18 n=1 Tax=Canna indica TaxID=4628 RepID=A0AAQ3Q1C7_9LILI|nr:transcription factor bHLH18 [Canna indica]